MYKYTFIMEFRGGTYISQVDAEGLASAIVLWSSNLDINEIKHLGITGKAKLIEEVKQEIPSPLRGLANVWFLAATTRSGFAMINVIKTSLD